MSAFHTSLCWDSRNVHSAAAFHFIHLMLITEVLNALPRRAPNSMRRLSLSILSWRWRSESSGVPAASFELMLPDRKEITDALNARPPRRSPSSMLRLRRSWRRRSASSGSSVARRASLAPVLLVLALGPFGVCSSNSTNVRRQQGHGVGRVALFGVGGLLELGRLERLLAVLEGVAAGILLGGGDLDH